MRKRDILVVVFWVALGLFVTIWSYAKLGIGKLNTPGSGLMPFVLGLLFTVLALYRLIRRALPSSAEEVEVSSPEESGEQGVDYKKLVYAMAAMFAFAILIEPLGFIITTFLTMLVLFRSSGYSRWSVAALYAAIIVLITYLLFTYLGTRFPPGILRALGLN